MNPAVSPDIYLQKTSITSSFSSISFTSQHRQLFRQLSLLFRYPTTHPRKIIENIVPIISNISDEGKQLIQRFKEMSESLSVPQLQECYSDLLDMNPHFHPYVGAQLLGESYKRSIFLIKLKEVYRENGFEPPMNELADHLAIILEFISMSQNVDVTRELIEDALIPALNKIVDESNLSIENALMGTNPIKNPYVYLYFLLRKVVIKLISSK